MKLQAVGLGSVLFAGLAQAQLSLVEVGGVPMSGNVALWSSGATAHASSYLSASYHQIWGLNDGWYGNNGNINHGGGAGVSGASWIAGELSAVAGVTLSGPQTIDHVAWGRDSSLTWTERTAGIYHFEVSTDGLDFFDGNKVWSTVGSVTLADHTASDSKRHLYSFDPIFGATDARLRIEAYGQAICVEELELYGVVPEPGTLAVTGLGAALALWRNKRRR